MVLHYLPIFIAVNIVIFPLILWTIAVCLGHIEPLLPFVSDLGVLAPEASLFSLFMNAGSTLLLVFTAIRYSSIKTFTHFNSVSNDEKTYLHSFNKRSLISGICMAIGFAIVANFRNSESTLVQVVHNIGAVMGFLSTVTDMAFQSKVASHMSLNSTGRLRCILAAVALCLAICYNGLSVWSFVLYPDALKDTELRLKWNSSQPGYAIHVISTTLEWILIFMICPYIWTFVAEFRKYSFAKYLVNYSDVKDDNENNVNFRQLNDS